MIPYITFSHYLYREYRIIYFLHPPSTEILARKSYKEDEKVRNFKSPFKSEKKETAFRQNWPNNVINTLTQPITPPLLCQIFLSRLPSSFLALLSSLPLPRQQSNSFDNTAKKLHTQPLLSPAQRAHIQRANNRAIHGITCSYIQREDEHPSRPPLIPSPPRPPPPPNSTPKSRVIERRPRPLPRNAEPPCFSPPHRPTVPAIVAAISRIWEGGDEERPPLHSRYLTTGRR